VSLSIIVLALVTAQRLGELALANRNTRRLLAMGAKEHGARHYPVIVAMHAAWLAGLWIFGWDRPIDPFWLVVFVILQGLRMWVISTLGGRWTTRIIVLPGAPRIRRGPFRFISHPNYAVVSAEIAVLPLAFGLPIFAAVFFVLNAAVLTIRIRAESAALDGQKA
jgi:methyltransferase